MGDLTAGRFAEFHRAIHPRCKRPHPWQVRLARGVVERGEWPASINIPTGCGKTSCIDIAVYALACRPADSPRRVVFAVNRRVVVDGAHERAMLIARKLGDAKDGILGDVRDKLCGIAGCSDAPLAPVLLRGGTYIDRDWHANPAQPCVISTTVDQAGSRLLFRGYGVGSASRVVEAGLLGSDCLWILDETHISQPFTRTLRAVEGYGKAPWAKKRPSRPWRVVEMTATPVGGVPPGHGRSDDDRRPAEPAAASKGRRPAAFELGDDDRRSEVLSRVLGASKVCDLVMSKAKDSGDHEALAKDLAKCARSLRAKFSCKKVAVVANRVATAKHVYDEIRSGGFEAYLLIGRMRPWDRDAILSRINERFKTGCPNRPARGGDAQDNAGSPPVTFVVSTQCIEVGADLNFDGMVSEASSLDSLRQRFGRLNRDGMCEPCRGAIVAPADVHRKKAKNDSAGDPIYGEAAAKTWALLARDGRSEIDFGIDRISNEIEKAAGEPAALEGTSLAPPDGPELLPSHLDLLCQTSRKLGADPDVAPFLHGFERGVPTVSVVWRSGLLKDDPDSALRARHAAFAAALAALPPRSAESMPVPIWSIRRFLGGGRAGLDSGGDAEWQRLGAPPLEDGGAGRSKTFPTAFIWRGKKRALLRIVKDDHMEEKLRGDLGGENGAAGDEFARIGNIRPNDVVILSSDSCGWNELGHVPDMADGGGDCGGENTAATIDIAEQVAFEATGGIVEKTGGCDRRSGGERHPYRVQGSVAIRMADDGRYPFPMTDEARRFRTAIDNQEPRSSREEILDAAREKIPEIVRQISKKPDFGGGSGAKRDRAAPPTGSRREERIDMDIESMSCTMQTMADGKEVLLIAKRKSGRAGPIDGSFLDKHMKDVADSVQKYATGLGLDPVGDLVEILGTAALLHDAGKADRRFQQMLHRSLLPLPRDFELRAKDNGLPNGRRYRRYPKGFRHELVSSRLAEDVETHDRDLFLHLIESHHGHCRPLAPAVRDPDGGPVEYEFKGRTLRASPSTGLEKAGSGASKRFWSCTRRYGWWGLAWIEALFLLADWNVSGGRSSRNDR